MLNCLDSKFLHLQLGVHLELSIPVFFTGIPYKVSLQLFLLQAIKLKKNKRN